MKHPLFLLALLLTLGVAACQSRTDADLNAADSTATSDTMAMGNTIADLIASDPQFSTLQRALEATDLDQSLQGAGPFTLFAPTDAAFAKLGAQVDTLLLDRNHAQLREILMYHITDGRYTAAQVRADSSLMTLQGSDLDVRATDGSVLLNSTATITGTDFEASNGVIHVVDAVLLPATDDEPNV